MSAHGNAVKDLSLCFRAKGPSVRIAWANGPSACESPVPKPQSGRPFNGDESNRRPVGLLSMIKTLVTTAAGLVNRAAGPGNWNEWPIGPEPQAVPSLPFLLFSKSGQFHHILRKKKPSQRCPFRAMSIEDCCQPGAAFIRIRGFTRPRLTCWAPLGRNAVFPALKIRVCRPNATPLSATG